MRIAGKGLHGATRFIPLIASLIRAERTHRQPARSAIAIGGAKFPVLKDIEQSSSRHDGR